MSSQNSVHHMQKRWEKRLSFEGLECRQLLSAAPIGVDTEVAVVTASVLTDSMPQIDYSIASVEEAAPAAEVAPQLALLTEGMSVSAESSVNLCAVGTKMAVQFQAEPGAYTVVLKGTDNTGKGKDVLTLRNVNVAQRNIQDGLYSFNYTAKADYTYEVSVVKGKFSNKDYTASGGYIPDEILVGSDTISILSPLEFVEVKGAATANSITFQQKNGEAVQSLDNLTFLAKFDGDRNASTYSAENGKLVCGDRSYDAALNEDGSITISGLKLNMKHSFQVSQTEGNAVSAYSRNLTIATTKEQKAAPTEVAAALNEAGGVTVTWKGEAGATYTITCESTDAKGKVTTKNISTKATVDGELVGSYTVSKLASGTKYIFKVSANKTKDNDASVAVASNAIITATVIPAPTMKKVSAMDTSVTLQVTNWDKMGAALQEVGDAVNNVATGGTFVVKSGEETLATFVYTETTTEVDGVLSTTGEWVNTTEGSTSTMKCVEVNKKSTAEITITGLTASTKYSFQTTAFSDVVNDNINTVVVAKTVSGVVMSKSVDVKTEITAYPAVTNLTTSNVTSANVSISWTASELANGTAASNYVVTLTSETGGKITKTVKDTKVTITGLKPGTTYTISVVAKADKNGSASEPTTTTVTTLSEMRVSRAIKVEPYKYALDFGQDMTQSSGRLDFSVQASGRAYNPRDGKWYSDGGSASYSMFYGNNAKSMAVAYQLANPTTSVLVLNADNSISALESDSGAPVPQTDIHTETVSSSKYDLEIGLTTEFQRNANGYSTIGIGAKANYEYHGNATLTLEGGINYDELTGTSAYIKAGVKMRFSK